MTKASLVIPSRGGAARLPVLLDALAAQTHPDWEAIVVLDGDIDGSQAVVQRYGSLPVRCITFPDNRGRVSALNAGFEATTGDVLIRCDDDLEPSCDFIALHVQHHNRSQATGVIGAYDNQTPMNRYARVYGREADAIHLHKVQSASPDETWRFWAGNCSISRSTWHSVGTYDTRYRAYGWEDVDYGFRVAQAGVHIVIDPALTTTHHAASVDVASRARRAFHSGAARRVFDAIHGAGHSGPGRLEQTSIWTAAVKALAKNLSYDRTIALARFVDVSIYAVPAPMAKKMIALLVEAASWAGYDSEKRRANDF